MTQIFQLYVFILAGILGFVVISRVPPLLHTPLMSATNAISGISLVGAIVAAGGQYGRLATVLGFIAVVCAATNVAAGFLITDRMLAMFKGPKPESGTSKGDVRQLASGDGQRKPGGAAGKA
jgi:NAD(P) transhydrogenase subunit alpha